MTLRLFFYLPMVIAELEFLQERVNNKKPGVGTVVSNINVNRISNSDYIREYS